MNGVGAGVVVSGLVLTSALLVSWTPVRGRRSDPHSAGWPSVAWSRLRAGRRGGSGSAVPDEDLRAAAVAERAAALLRAGVAPAVAWQHAAGGSAGDWAGDSAPGSVGDPVAAPVRAVWELVQRTGAPAAEALEASAAGVRADAAARAAVRTALAGARISARTVSALPLLGLLLGAGLGAEPWTVLVGTAPGRICAVLGLALLLLGRWWSGRLVRTAEAAGR